MKRTAGILMAALLMPGAAQAAFEGRWALKGVGTASCQQYVDARKNADAAYYQFGGWINGYFSAFNQFTDETYDIAPWQGTELLAGLVEGYCQKNPKQPFATSVIAVVKLLMPQRLVVDTQRVAVEPGRSMYKEVVQRLQYKLDRLGFADVPQNGVLDKATRAAILQYQQQKDLEQSGLPDQQTLFRLFIYDPDNPVKKPPPSLPAARLESKPEEPSLDPSAR